MSAIALEILEEALAPLRQKVEELVARDKAMHENYQAGLISVAKDVGAIYEKRIAALQAEIAERDRTIARLQQEAA